MAINRTMFDKAKYRYLSNTVTLRDPASARKATRVLIRQFEAAKTQPKKLRILRATVLAGNRARAAASRKAVSQRERSELKVIAQQYSNAAAKMRYQYSQNKPKRK